MPATRRLAARPSSRCRAPARPPRSEQLGDPGSRPPSRRGRGGRCQCRAGRRRPSRQRSSRAATAARLVDRVAELGPSTMGRAGRRPRGQRGRRRAGSAAPPRRARPGPPPWSAGRATARGARAPPPRSGRAPGTGARRGSSRREDAHLRHLAREQQPTETSRRRRRAARPLRRARVQRRPVGALAYGAHGSSASGMPSRPSNPQAEPSPGSSASGSSAKAASMTSGRASRVRSRPIRTASVRLPARRSVSMSRTLLTTRIAVGEEADRDRQEHRQRVELLELHVVGAVDGDEAEEDEDEDLAEPLVSVGPRTARVEDARGDRERRRSRGSPAHHDRQVEAAATATAKATQVATSTRLGATSPAAVTRTGPSRSTVSAPRLASE